MLGRALEAAEEHALAARLVERLDPRFAVRLRPVDAIGRTASGKYEDFVCG